MSLETLFPSPELTEGEITLLIQIYRNPAVKKHLKLMALNDAKELLTLSSSNKTPEEIALAHATISGRLSTLSTLVNFIEEVSTPEVQPV